MDDSHPLKTLLQVQLASDSHAVFHLPFILETLTKEDFARSPHTQKWIARLNSLIHAKDPAAKWSGLCLAFQTATFSRDLMLECAQSWVGAALPLLVNQPAPTTKASIRLLRLIFSSAQDVPEFQRQLCIPNVPKFASALVAIVEAECSQDVMSLVIETLTHIVSLYPSLCRPLHAPLSNVALRALNGSAPIPMPHERVAACSKLYAVLPLTGGKVNAPNLWRKSLEDTIAFAWGAFLQLRTTYPNRGLPPTTVSNPISQDPVVAIPLALDRLYAAVQVIDNLLRANPPRAVTLPMGPLEQLCSKMLQCSEKEKPEPHADPVTHSLERAITPTIWQFACTLLVSVSSVGQRHLTPYAPTLLTQLAYHLEETQVPSRVLRSLEAIKSIVRNGTHFHDDVVASRLVRAILPRLSILLSGRSQADGSEQGSAQSRSKKSKKRARGYEGDEVFTVGRGIVCSTLDEGNVLLSAIEALETLLVKSQINASVRSIASRLLLAIYASFPQMPPALLSPDSSLHGRLQSRIQRACTRLSIGTTSTMSKSLGLILGISGHTTVQDGNMTILTELDLLLHPRVPPLVRSLPQVEMLSLFRAEEGQEEQDARKRIGVAAFDEDNPEEPNIAAGSQTPQVVIPQIISSATGHAPHTAKCAESSLSHGGDPAAMRMDSVPTPAPAADVSRGPEYVFPAGFVAPQTLDHSQPRLSPSPPPQDPLRPSTVALGPPSTTLAPPGVSHVTPAAAPVDEEDDEDEPMPTIDLGSDSESE